MTHMVRAGGGGGGGGAAGGGAAEAKEEKKEEPEEEEEDEVRQPLTLVLHRMASLCRLAASSACPHLHGQACRAVRDVCVGVLAMALHGTQKRIPERLRQHVRQERGILWLVVQQEHSRPCQAAGAAFGAGFV